MAPEPKMLVENTNTLATNSKIDPTSSNSSENSNNNALSPQEQAALDLLLKKKSGNNSEGSETINGEAE